MRNSRAKALFTTSIINNNSSVKICLICIICVQKAIIHTEIHPQKSPRTYWKYSGAEDRPADYQR